MPVKLRSADLETATARLKLAPRKAVYRLRVANGVALGYRRTVRASAPGAPSSRTAARRS